MVSAPSLYLLVFLSYITYRLVKMDNQLGPRGLHSHPQACVLVFSSISRVLSKGFKSYLPALRLDSNAPHSIKPS